MSGQSKKGTSPLSELEIYTYFIIINVLFKKKFPSEKSSFFMLHLIFVF